MLRLLLEREVQSGAGWQSIEAVLYCIRSTAEAIEPGENTHTPAIVASLPSVRRVHQLDVVHAAQLPMHPILSRTALLTVGSLSDWLKQQPNAAELLAQVHLALAAEKPVDCAQMVQFTLGGFSVHASAASVALKDLCDVCGEELLPWTDDIMTICLGILDSKARILTSSTAL